MKKNIKALLILSEFKIEQMPIVTFGKKILGMIDKKIILNLLMEDLDNTENVFLRLTHTDNINHTLCYYGLEPRYRLNNINKMIDNNLMKFNIVVDYEAELKIPNYIKLLESSGTVEDIIVQIGLETITFDTPTGTLSSAFAGALQYDLTDTTGDDTITGGAGNDILNYAATTDLFTSNAVVDSIVGGDGVDTLLVGTSGTAFAIANTNVWSRISDVETVKAAAYIDAVTIALDVSAAVAGITKVDLSDAAKSSGNVIDVSEFTASTDTTLVGSSVGNTDITGGAGIGGY